MKSLSEVIFDKSIDNYTKDVVYERGQLEKLKGRFNSKIKDFERQFDGRMNERKLDRAHDYLDKANIEAIRVSQCAKRVQRNSSDSKAARLIKNGAKSSNDEVQSIYRTAQKQLDHAVRLFNDIRAAE